MSDLNYSKKQLAPIISKYEIDPEKNTLFHRVIELFASQPNYHVWAVKVIFSGATNIEALERIKAWADANQKVICMLQKNGNLVSYTTKDDFRQLAVEIEGIARIQTVKGVISTFNTDQRHLLEQATNIANINSMTAMSNKQFTKWFNRLEGFSHLHKSKRNKVIRVLSAVRDNAQLERLIDDALRETYIWDKEDMLNFVKNNCPNVSVIYDQGPIVILEIPSYDDSHKICYGRTQWCITRSSDYFRQYVTDHKGNRQFFFFDFSKKEDHQLAHVGFTVSPKGGIVNAHSTQNTNMLHEGFTLDGQRWNIQRVLVENNIGMSTFMNLKAFSGRAWHMDDIIELIDKTNGATIVLEKNNVLIVKVSTPAALNQLIGFTLIPRESIMSTSAATSNSTTDHNVYVVFNLNVDIKDNDSVIAMNYAKDTYGILSLSNIFTTYGASVDKSNPLSKYGISSDDFIDRGKIDPNILLHKYLDERDEAAAIKLMETEGDKLDVNFKFNDHAPVTTAMENKLFGAFSQIVSNKNFDGDIDDQYGENLLQAILWSCYLDPSNKPTPEEEKALRSMLVTLIESGRFDLNFVDMNLDTLINIAAMNPNMLWLLQYLTAMPEVDPNKVNDVDSTAFGNAIRNRNFEGAKILGRRPDLLVRDFDRAEAKEQGINIDDLINPTTFEELSTWISDTSKKYACENIAESFKMAYSKVN